MPPPSSSPSPDDVKNLEGMVNLEGMSAFASLTLGEKSEESVSVNSFFFKNGSRAIKKPMVTKKPYVAILIIFFK